MSDLLIDNDLLISLVEQKPVLWDKTLDIYKDRDATKNAWKEVCVEIRCDFGDLDDKEKTAFGKEVLKRWKNLRDSFAKAEKKVQEGKASGSGAQATKRRRNIFNDELKFLKKVYTGREVIESYNTENEEGATPEVTSCIETDQPDTPTIADKTQSHKTRRHKKVDEVDLKIIKALESQKDEPNSKMLFFKSLLPHIDSFNQSEMLQLQMGVLQVISSITCKKTTVLPNQGYPTPFINQPTPYHPQSYNNFQTPSQQFFTPQIHTSFNSPSQTVSSIPPFANHTPIRTPLPAQYTKRTPALSPTTVNEEPRSESAQHYVETFIPREDATNGSSSFCSNSSSPLTLDFCNV